MFEFFFSRIYKSLCCGKVDWVILSFKLKIRYIGVFFLDSVVYVYGKRKVVDCFMFCFLRLGSIEVREFI